MAKNIALTLNDDLLLEKIADAFSSGYRRKIIRLLAIKSRTAVEISNLLDISKSTTSFHLKFLKEAGLIKETPAPKSKGNQKNISLCVPMISLRMISEHDMNNKTKYVEIPISSFTEYDVEPPCSIATKDHWLMPNDSILIFDSFERTQAQLISFTSGFIAYKINMEPYKLIGEEFKSITFSMEICSECPFYNNDWKSNITFKINDVEVGEFLSLGDYGGRRGKYTPIHYSPTATNYGVMVTLMINNKGTYINGEIASKNTIESLGIDKNPILKLSLGVKKDATYCGGLSIFGKHFGDYPQGINLTIDYKSDS